MKRLQIKKSMPLETKPFNTINDGIKTRARARAHTHARAHTNTYTPVIISEDCTELWSGGRNYSLHGVSVFLVFCSVSPKARVHSVLPGHVHYHQQSSCPSALHAFHTTHSSLPVSHPQSCCIHSQPLQALFCSSHSDFQTIPKKRRSKQIQ